MFQKFNFDTEWAVKLISRITNDEDIPIEGDAIVKQLLALQINAEKYFFGIRKSLVEFDEVLEVTMKVVPNTYHSEYTSVTIFASKELELGQTLEGVHRYWGKAVGWNGGYRTTTNLLRKYLGDLLIASYWNVVQESSYDDAYVKEIEVSFSLELFSH
ncbi:hypothetical protein GH714_023060 [Hevea brasiliensis]|nr:hypothetical protein GH714_023060 [Hevea brasiliensis]